MELDGGSTIWDIAISMGLCDNLVVLFVEYQFLVWVVIMIQILTSDSSTTVVRGLIAL